MALFLTTEMVTQLFAQRYRIIREIGAGGMGVVFEAEDELLKKKVAVKTIHKGIFTAEHIVRFQREATVLANLNHPNLVPVYVFGLTDDNEPYMVMNYEKGKTLHEIIEGRGRFPLYKSLNVFIQICDAMQHVHEHNVLHRDLKPGNIIVRHTENENPSIVVIDFGVAMIATGDAIDSLTRTGMLVGTPVCMSPEQIRGHELDARSDIYALGCLMFETLTGKLPFAAPSALELLNLKLTKAPPSMLDAAPDLDLPSGIAEIVLKALAPLPGDRYQNMFDLKMDLIAFKSGDYKSSSVEAPPPPEPPKAKKRVVLSAARVALIAAIVGLTLIPFLIFFHSRESRKQLSVTEKAKLEEEHTVKTVNLAIDHLFKKGHKDGVVKGDFYTNSSYNDEKAASFINSYFGIIKAVNLHGGEVTGKFFDKVIANRKTITVVRTLGANITDDGLKAASRLPCLNDVDLNDEAQITPKGISYLRKVPNLSRFTFCGYGLTPAHIDEIVKLPKVEVLNLSSASVTDDSIEKIAAMPKLKVLIFTGSNVTAKGLAILAPMKPNLEMLGVSSVNLGDEGVEQIVKMKLKKLEIRNNPRISDRGLAMIASMKGLAELIIDDGMGTKGGRAALTKSLTPNTRIRMRMGIDETVADFGDMQLGK